MRKLSIVVAVVSACLVYISGCGGALTAPVDETGVFAMTDGGDNEFEFHDTSGDPAMFHDCTVEFDPYAPAGGVNPSVVATGEITVRGYAVDETLYRWEGEYTKDASHHVVASGLSLVQPNTPESSMDLNITLWTDDSLTGVVTEEYDGDTSPQQLFNGHRVNP
ncbi:MAG: hypothetical protein KAW89_07840 [Armatimonadetes bacterium]|nr:hypothetical protein [Armatimonadota bacterium]